MLQLRGTSGRTSLLATITCLLITIFSMADGYASILYSAIGKATQSPEPGGGFSYSFNVSVRPYPPPFLPWDMITSFTAGDGTILNPINGFVEFTNLSLVELQSKFTGTWTFTETLSSETFLYEFTLPEISLDNFEEIPVITSPEEGAVVSTSLDLEWILPSGNEPDGFSGSIEGAAFGNINLHGPGSATVGIELPEGVVEQPIMIRLGQAGSTQVDFSVSPITPGANGQFRDTRILLDAFGAPFGLTVRIPEPTTYGLAMIATLCLAVGRRRR